jgi:hypothetical protein
VRTDRLHAILTGDSRIPPRPRSVRGPRVA